MTKATKSANGKIPTEQTAQPLFFIDPYPINPERHATAGIRKSTDMQFARIANSVIVTIDEIPEAARSYPIVFTPEKGVPRPIAVLSLSKENSFIDADGKWDSAHYVPSYIRRYPFGLAGVPDSEELALCIDESAPHFMAKDADIRLFDDAGKATSLTSDALEFCGRFQALNNETLNFGKAVKEADLLHLQNLEVKLASGEKRAIENLLLLDKDRWHNFAKTNANSWEEKGYLALMVMILASQANWKYLATRTNEQQARKAA